MTDSVEFSFDQLYTAALDPQADFGFEGAEKRLEIDFKFNADSTNGLRSIDQDTWQEVLNHVNCTIISSMKNDYLDSYVLSESSLFVYPFKVMIKTCGTTTLLKCIPHLLELAYTHCGLSVEFVMFSRKNYLFPHKQKQMHRTWDYELKYLDEIFDGHSYVIGPQSGDHWHLFLADYSDNGRVVMPEKTLEIMMHKLDPTQASKFYRQDDTGDKDKFPGVADLVPGSTTDEFNFTPCGYSMNGLAEKSFYTIHVTPEPNCSYASFETNLSLHSYNKLVNAVLDLFRPGSATVTFFSEKASNAPVATSLPFDLDIDGYILKHKNVSELEGNCDVLMFNYESIEFASRAKANKCVKLPFFQNAAADAPPPAICY